MRKFKVFIPLLPAIIFCGLFFCYPLLHILALSVKGPNLDIGSYVEVFRTTLYLRVIVNTLLISLTVTFLCLTLGYPVAYLLSTTTQRVRNILMFFVILPFWISILVRTYAWMVILRRNGVVNQILLEAGLIKQPLALMYNFVGVNVAMVHILLPLMILALYGVMRGIDKEILLVARNLGAGRLWTFLKIYFPLSFPGIIAGSFIVFIIAVGYFITPALVGGREQTMVSMLIDNQINYLLNWSFGSALSIVLLVLVGVIFVIFNRFLGLDRIWGGLR